MSSEHAIIVARNNATGAVELPLGDVTLYDTSVYGLDDKKGGIGSVASIMQQCRSQYDEHWTLTLYVQKGASYSGANATEEIA